MNPSGFRAVAPPAASAAGGVSAFERLTGPIPAGRGYSPLMQKSGLRAMAVLGVGLLVAGCAHLGLGEGPGGQGGAAPVVRAVPTVLVVDSSGSMAEADAPGPRIDAAKQASSALMSALPEGTPTALVTYGSNTDDMPESQAESCRDITLLRSLAPLEGDADGRGGAVDTAIEGLAPGGFTPIGRALETAAAELAASDVEGEKAIVLISDGEDTCGDPTPCEAARSIKQAQPDVVISTIGFKSDVEELGCVARETGGLYLTADNVDQLVSRVVAAQNAPAGIAALTPTGRGGVELGQHFDEIRSAHPDFPAQSEGVGEGDLTVIRWVDCDWVFDGDGRLVEIRDDRAATIDGLAPGDSAESARTMYGEPVESTPGSDGQWVGVYPASQEAGTAWRISYGPSDEIRTIVLCACLPGSGTATRFKGIPAGVPDWARQPGGPEVEILRPVDSRGVVQDGWKVEPASASLACSESRGTVYPSYAAVEEGLVVCDDTTAAAAKNCWPDTTGRNALCLRDPFEGTLVEIGSPYVLTGQPPGADPSVIGVELANGKQCILISGGAGDHVRVGDKIYSSRFSCDGGVGYESHGEGASSFFRDGSRLMLLYSAENRSSAPAGDRTATKVEVTKLIFLGTA